MPRTMLVIFRLPRPCGGGGTRSVTEGVFSSPSPIARRRLTLLLIPLFLIPTLLLPACVQRKIRVTSTPPGARVILNDQEIGVTPVDTRFTFYGGYDVQLLLEGYEPVHELRQAKAPLHEYPGIDLVATAIPADIETTIQWHFDLTQVEEATDPEAARESLLERAETMRNQAQSDSN